MNKEEQRVETSTEAAIVGNTVIAAGWISVRQKLPEVGHDYLVTDGAACMVAAFRLENQEWDFWGIRWWSNDEVTHWMPLPSTPACS